MGAIFTVIRKIIGVFFRAPAVNYVEEEEEEHHQPIPMCTPPRFRLGHDGSFTTEDDSEETLLNSDQEDDEHDEPQAMFTSRIRFNGAFIKNEDSEGPSITSDEDEDEREDSEEQQAIVAPERFHYDGGYNDNFEGEGGIGRIRRSISPTQRRN